MGLSSSKNKSASKKPSASVVTELDRTVLTLKTQRNKLNAEQKLLDARIDRHAEVARELLKAGRKDRALLALKKKKLVMNQQQTLATHILNLEGMLSNIETSKQQSKMLAALQAGNDVLKQLQSTMQIDDVKRLMEDTAEAKAYQDELNAILSQSLSEVDDEAVMAEMAALEDTELQQEMALMPTVPTTLPEKAVTELVQNVPAQEAKEAEATKPRQAMLAS